MSTHSDISRISDLSVLRTKRGARKRNIGQVETYLRSVQKLSPKHLKLAELTRQLDFLQGQSNLCQEIQERVVQLLEDSDPDNRLEEEEQELEDQCLAHAILRDILQEVQGRPTKGTLLSEQLSKLWRALILAGTYFKEALDDISKDLKE